HRPRPRGRRSRRRDRRDRNTRGHRRGGGVVHGPVPARCSAEGRRRGRLVATRAHPHSPDKAWLLRALLVLQSPRSVFAALRDDSDESAGERQDVAGALVWLAGIAGVLATTVAGRLLDDVEIDGLLVAVWAFLAGGLYGFTMYYAVGKVFHVALRRLASRGSLRRARHVLAFAATPIALALFVYWPVRIALSGGALFRTGGAD